jgi:hypothetical protein
MLLAGLILVLLLLVALRVVLLLLVPLRVLFLRHLDVLQSCEGSWAENDPRPSRQLQTAAAVPGSDRLILRKGLEYQVKMPHYATSEVNRCATIFGLRGAEL